MSRNYYKYKKFKIFLFFDNDILMYEPSFTSHKTFLNLFLIEIIIYSAVRQMEAAHIFVSKGNVWIK